MSSRCHSRRVALVALLVLAWLPLGVAQAPPRPASGVSVSAPLTGGPLAQSITLSAATVARYARLDVSFTLNHTYANPYYSYDATDTVAANPATMTWVGANGVTVNCVIVTPTTTVTIPAFWMQDYARVEESSVEILGAASTGHWACRYTPSEVGTYSLSVSAQDSTGTGTSSAQTFTSTAASPSRGFVKASTSDARFLKYDDGSSFIPIGYGAQWWTPTTARKSYDYDTRFGTAGTNGGNLTRIWDASDFALSVEGATMPNWIKQGTTSGAAEGIDVNTANVHGGFRSAKPTVGSGWYQRLVVSSPSTLHRLNVWTKTDTVAGGTCQVLVKATAASFNTGTTLGSTATLAGTNGWTLQTTTFTPNDSAVAINLVQSAGTGTCYFDDLEFGPDNGASGVTYNIISDGDFERHFFAGNPGNDPSGTPTLSRPIGTFINQWAAYEMDAIVAAAETNGIAMQVCTCSGPWFTWPTDPQNLTTTADFNQAWVLASYKRSLRYHIARWGYSTSILAWEYHNEWGHINSSGTPGQYNMLVALNAYVATTDPYGHLRTASQNSQAYSPQLWSSSGMDLANTHFYFDTTIASINANEVLGVERYAECHTQAIAPASTPYCTGLGLGDGSAWTGAAKPWVWGETGAATDTTQATPIATTGTAGCRFLSNIVWAGLFSPFGTTPLEWWWYLEDATATNCKLAARAAAAAYFKGVSYHDAGFTYFMTTDYAPPSWAGGLATTSDTTNSAVLGMRRSDQLTAYVFVHNKGYIYSNAGTPTTVSPTITLPNSSLLASTVYRIELWNTATGVASALTTATSTAGGAISFVATNLSSSVAVKISIADWPQFQVNAQRTGSVPEGTDGTYTMTYAWIGPSQLATSLPLAFSSSPITVAGRVQPVIQNNRLLIGTEDGTVYALNAATGANLWNRALDSGVVTTGAVRYGTAVFVTVNGIVYGLNSSTGAILWQRDLSCVVTSSPLLDGDKIYVTNHCGMMSALSINDGSLLWSTNIDNGTPIEGDMATDGTYVFTGTENLKFHKVRASTGAVVASIQLRGQSFQATNPVYLAGKVWVTSVLTASRGTEGLAEDLFAASASLVDEETNIGTFLQGTGAVGSQRSVDWQHAFAIDVSTWTQPFTILSMGSEGTGHPPDSMVADNAGRILTYGKTRYPSLIGNVGNTFGTNYTIDIFAINQSTGARITLGGGTRNSFPWETDNLFALSVAGNELWLNSRARGTTVLRTYATSSTRTYVRAYVDSDPEDMSDNCPFTFPNCYVATTPRLSTSQKDYVWWPATVVVGGKAYISENFGITLFQ